MHKDRMNNSIRVTNMAERQRGIGFGVRRKGE